MDDPATYGPELHRLPFSRAVERDLLSDYKVVVLAMSEQHVDAALQAHLASGDSEINITDAAKIVGCWRALQNPENKRLGDAPIQHLTRAIAFTNTIVSSKRLEAHWDSIVGHAIDLLPEAERPDAFRCKTRHVDGQHHALERKARIEWLKADSEGTCRILSNARCLSEGIDVPALDAVLFMNPKNSQVDIVQAVGRVMRKAEGKQYGYIVLPGRRAGGRRPGRGSRRQRTVRRGLERLGGRYARTMTGSMPRSTRSTSMTRRPIGSSSAVMGSTERAPPNCPFRRSTCHPALYSPRSSRDAGTENTGRPGPGTLQISSRRLVHRIEALLASPDNETLREWFDAFHEELKVSINTSIQPG